MKVVLDEFGVLLLSCPFAFWLFHSHHFFEFEVMNQWTGIEGCIQIQDTCERVFLVLDYRCMP